MKRLSTILLLTSLAMPASAAIVYLKDGSQATGTVVGATALDLTLLTSEGTLKISAGRIERVDYAGQSEPAPPPSIPPPPMPEEAPAQEPVATPPPADDHRQLVSAAFGYAAPLSNVNIGGQTLHNGYVGGLASVQYLYFPTKRLGAGIDVTYSNRSSVYLKQNFLPNTVARVSGDTTLLMAVVRYELRDKGHVRPFVLAGAGGGYNTLQIDARPLDSSAGWSDTGTHEYRRVVSGGAWEPAATLRAGLDFVFFRRLLITGEIGWTGLAGARYAATSQGAALGLGDATGPVNAVVIATRCGWRF